MGGCLSDTKGGQQAVGVGRGGGSGGGGGSNEAVDFFFRSQGMHRLYSEVEVLEAAECDGMVDVREGIIQWLTLGRASYRRNRTRVFEGKKDKLRLGYVSILPQEGLVSGQGHHAFSVFYLSLSASKLSDLDLFSVSDPMAVVYMKKANGVLQELGRTEVIMNELNPVWISKIAVTYHFEMVQSLLFHVYDVDSKYHNISTKNLNLNEQDFLGEADCYLSEIVTRNNWSLTLSLRNRDGLSNKRKMGTLTVRAEETVASRTVVEFTLRCSNLKNKDVFSKSDPFLRVSRIVENGEPIPIFKTEVVKNNLNPIWRPVCLKMQQFVSKDNPLMIECCDFNSNGKHILLGKLQKSIADFERLYIEKMGTHFTEPSLYSTEKTSKAQLFVDKFVEKVQYSFLDYISGGFELNFMVAVDFTASNGSPHLPNSLHFIDPSGQLNAYQQAMQQVGEVIQFYDSDRRFHAWGFGGRLADGTLSHCFGLNGNSQEYEVEGVEGIMSAYRNALHNVSLAGPTLFGPVINRAAQISSCALAANQRKYYVLLIITDGVITDIQETKDAIVKASDLPLSILIVGVGGADFRAMEVLDADNGQRLESTTGRIASRDIVQFVPMREVNIGQISIVQGLLEELPGQFLAYVRSRDMKPSFATATNL